MYATQKVNAWQKQHHKHRGRENKPEQTASLIPLMQFRNSDKVLSKTTCLLHTCNKNIDLFADIYLNVEILSINTPFVFVIIPVLKIFGTERYAQGLFKWIFPNCNAPIYPQSSPVHILSHFSVFITSEWNFKGGIVCWNRRVLTLYGPSPLTHCYTLQMELWVCEDKCIHPKLWDTLGAKYPTELETTCFYRLSLNSVL